MGKLDFVVKLLWCFGYDVANQSSFFKRPNNKLKAYTTIVYAVLSMCISIKNQNQKLLLLKALTGVTAKFRNNIQTTKEISTRFKAKPKNKKTK